MLQKVEKVKDKDGKDLIEVTLAWYPEWLRTTIQLTPNQAKGLSHFLRDITETKTLDEAVTHNKVIKIEGWIS